MKLVFDAPFQQQESAVPEHNLCSQLVNYISNVLNP